MWNIISGYPQHPSPYFSALERAFVIEGLVCKHFGELGDAVESSGFISLHRLQRLYYNKTFADVGMMNNSLGLLSKAKRRGLRLVWTIHNLLPIYNSTPELDRLFMREVLDLVDVVVCHTHADASSVRVLRPGVRVEVCGSAGLWMGESEPDNSIKPLIVAMDQSSQIFLAFGHITAYKDLIKLSESFLTSTIDCTLFIVGEARDAILLDALRKIERKSSGRIFLWPHRVSPSNAYLLYKRSVAAICGYDTSGRYEYFRDVLHASSISTARGFNIPVITPDLPATRELARGIPALFYNERLPDLLSVGSILNVAEYEFKKTSFLARAVDKEWMDIARTYKMLGDCL